MILDTVMEEIVKKNVCAGKLFGDSCDPKMLVQCNQGLYCDVFTNKCERQLGEGDFCSYFGENNDDESRIAQGSNFMVVCKGGLKCMGPYQRKACFKYRAGDVGYPCNWDRDRNQACKFGLVCGFDGKCGNYFDVYPSYQCNGAKRNCTFAGDEGCICDSSPNSATCKKTTDVTQCGFNRVANEYRDCLSRNNCAYEKNFLLSWTLDVFDGDSCMGKNCGGLSRTLMCCAFEKYNTERYSYYQIGPLGCNISGILITLLIVFLFIVFVSIAIIVILGGVIGFLLWKNKKDTNEFQNIE